MRYLIRLACGLAAGTLLLLTGASVAFAADPIVTIGGSDGTSSDVTAVADTGTSNATVTLGAGSSSTDGAGSNATVTLGAGAPTMAADGADGSASITLGAGSPATDGAGGDATVTLGAGAPTTAADGADGSATVTLGASSPNIDRADGDATVTLGAGAPTTDGADGTASVTFGAAAPDSVDDPSSSVGALSSGFGSLMAFGDTAAGETTGVAPAGPATDEALSGLSQAFGGLLASTGFFGAPSASGGSGGSGGSGNAAAAAAASGAGTLPETSTEALASRPSAGFPVLALLLGLLAGGLAARRRTVRSAT